ncbi:hypothetical protein AAG570_006093 [Ranatra chinensis]|uniref:Uncharacterized protein n=1 Tax=Ranatra chinensis TaxID=642074 RepID=A0ABD0Y9X6_9HEMI
MEDQRKTPGMPSYGECHQWVSKLRRRSRGRPNSESHMRVQIDERGGHRPMGVVVRTCLRLKQNGNTKLFRQFLDGEHLPEQRRRAFRAAEHRGADKRHRNQPTWDDRAPCKSENAIEPILQHFPKGKYSRETLRRHPVVTLSGLSLNIDAVENRTTPLRGLFNRRGGSRGWDSEDRAFTRGLE